MKIFFLKTFILFPFILFSSRVFAIDELQKLNIAKVLGWMEATCYYHNLGYIPKMEAEVFIKSSIEEIKVKVSHEHSKKAMALLLKKQPYCSSIIP